MLPHYRADIVCGLYALQESQQLEQLGITFIVVPTLNRNAIIDVIAVRMRRIIYKYRLDKKQQQEKIINGIEKINELVNTKKVTLTEKQFL